MEDLSTVKEASSAVDGTAATEAGDAGLEIAAKASIASALDKNVAEDAVEALRSKYDAEKNKRLRDDGLAQYVDLYDSPKFKHFSSDPFAASEPYASTNRTIKDGDECKFLVMGAGMAGLVGAARLRESGVAADDIWMVDSAGGFGGTWYWNRFPGLTCDVESYLYLPLLEETGYIPKHKYAHGYEIRGYMNLIADKYDLRRNALFSTLTVSTEWDENRSRWLTKLRRPNQPPVTVHSRFCLFAPGVLHVPKVTAAPGVAEFKGQMLHTSRWDFGITGGSEGQLEFEKLNDKVVAIIGTGGTAIQAVPHVARSAKKFYVVQRTPSAVDWRGQKETDPEEFRREVATGRRWQSDRHVNFCSMITDYPNVPKKNLVADAWTDAPSLQALLGGCNAPSSPEGIPEFLKLMHQFDLNRQERIRHRVSETVQDPETAEKLKAWYPGWCKRPTFHDSYLQTFNRPNVELVDTNGRGIDAFTESGIVVGGREIAVDVIIFATGYRWPGASLAARSNMTVKGRNGISFDDKWENNWGTLHSVLSRDFPNFFVFSNSQAASSVNYQGVMDRSARHMAYILTKAAHEAAVTGQSADDWFVEPTEKGEQEWGDLIASQAVSLAAMAGCTPGYFNAEGSTDHIPMEKRMTMARKSIWGHGFPDWIRVLDEYEYADSFEGFEVSH